MAKIEIQLSQIVFNRLTKLAKEKGLTINQFAQQVILDRCNLEETINSKLD